MAEFGWAYIGAGWIARKTAEAIVGKGRHRIVSVYNRTFARAEEFGAEFGAKPCATIAEAVNCDGVQGVYIGTLNHHHFEAAAECLRLGKPVLLEKPFTVSKAQAEELAQIARDNGAYLAEAMWTWFSPVSLQIKEWVQSGAIGEITHVDINYAGGGAKGFPRLLDPHTAGGALLDIGVYPITYCYNIWGMPEKVTCAGRLQGGVDVEETVTLTYPGLTVKPFVSVVHDKSMEDLRIAGTKGEIVCATCYRADTATLVQDGRETAFNANGWYDAMFDAVAAEIEAGKLESAYVPLKATLDVMGILDACRAEMGLVYPFEK